MKQILWQRKLDYPYHVLHTEDDFYFEDFPLKKMKEVLLFLKKRNPEFIYSLIDTDDPNWNYDDTIK